MEKRLDLKGLACPGPVVAVKKALESMETGVVIAVVDNPEAKENIERFAKNAGLGVSAEPKGSDFTLTITKPGAKEGGAVMPEPTPVFGKTVLYVASSIMGEENPQLGGVLIRAFFKTLLEIENQPDRIIFVHGGVRLSVNGSPVLDSLKALECRGVEILSCGTCLDFFSLKDQLAVGVVSNMFEIAGSLFSAGKVIRP